MPALTENKINEFTQRMALIAQKACDASGMNQDQKWKFMSAYHRTVAENYTSIHPFLVGISTGE
jgi:hypothetical protein